MILFVNCYITITVTVHISRPIENNIIIYINFIIMYYYRYRISINPRYSGMLTVYQNSAILCAA